MNRDLVAPLGTEDEPFPCPSCGGSGQVHPNLRRGVILCEECCGSGYGPPPPAVTHEQSHCLCRLAKWAKRELQPEEN